MHKRKWRLCGFHTLEAASIPTPDSESPSLPGRVFQVSASHGGDCRHRDSHWHWAVTHWRWQLERPRHAYRVSLGASVPDLIRKSIPKVPDSETRIGLPVLRAAVTGTFKLEASI